MEQTSPLRGGETLDDLLVGLVDVLDGARECSDRRLIMPAKVEAADGIRKMLGWDKAVKADQPEDDITEILATAPRDCSDVKNEPGTRCWAFTREQSFRRIV